MHPLAHFQTLARYNVWATARLLESVAAVSDGAYRRDVGLFFKSIHGTLNHLLVGEHLLWFRRFAEGISPKVALDAEVEPGRVALAERLQAGATCWAPLIASWPEQRFAGTLDYTTMRGTPVSLPFAATLAHVFNHGTHHRGQITAALTALGQPCPELDLVYFLQTEATAP
ncbi:DinB family protein [Simplicispira hankyongi]|uniref:Damage-inducible protein DinB n=1 Tax=Simplicispira hankyongi TaxID=2315688 RepID=A0A398CE13_9BURK|nr:DinB family protein [Simplicispira hankyongi]RID97093.1 damage-inducible protein DinB [Simplicispira hankyongi]